MSILTFNDNSLRRGNVTRAEVIEALDDPLTLEVEEGQSRRGNPTIMYVGKTQSERLLEVGVEYKQEETHVYHARKANAHYIIRYEKDRNN
jgi:uncharacterized DUF497 family protein